MKRDERKKVKTDGDQGHANPHADSADKYERHIDGSIVVRGEIETKVPPDLVQKHDREREEDGTQERKKFRVEIITLFFVAIVACLTAWQDYLTHEEVQVSQRGSRPFVGAAEFEFLYYGTADSPAVPFPTPQTVKMKVKKFIKNYGPLPALNFASDWRAYVDGVEKGRTGGTQFPETLNPSEGRHMDFPFGVDDTRAILDGKKTLTFSWRYSYDGPDGHYQECILERYEPTMYGIHTVGPCQN
jgi:hypothetical protein